MIVNGNFVTSRHDVSLWSRPGKIDDFDNAAGCNAAGWLHVKELATVLGVLHTEQGQELMILTAGLRIGWVLAEDVLLVPTSDLNIKLF